VEDLMAKRARWKNHKGVKGQMRVVESIMAALIVISAVTFLYFFAATPSSQAHDTSELEKLGHNVLHDIDEQGLLARYLYNSPPEWANLTAALVVSLPTNVYFNLSIYDINQHSIGHPLIQYGDPQIFSSSAAVASVTYIVPGYHTSYNPRILVLKLVNG
jgi:hypothetical protein